MTTSKNAHQSDGDIWNETRHHCSVHAKRCCTQTTKKNTKKHAADSNGTLLQCGQKSSTALSRALRFAKRIKHNKISELFNSQLTLIWTVGPLFKFWQNRIISLSPPLHLMRQAWTFTSRNLCGCSLAGNKNLSISFTIPVHEGKARKEQISYCSSAVNSSTPPCEVVDLHFRIPWQWFMPLGFQRIYESILV